MEQVKITVVSNNDVPLVLMHQLGHLSQEEYSDICADYAESVQAGSMTWEQVADAMFGPDPNVSRVA